MFSPQFLYLFALFTLSVASGIQIILLPWLVIDHLSLSSVWVGWVQAAVLIPSLLLILLGGISADRGSSQRYLVPLLFTNALLHGVLAYVIHSAWLSISLLLLYAVALGVGNAFIQPWREYLLRQVRDSSARVGLQSFVAKSSLCLYIGQAVGVSLSSFMETVGSQTLLLIQLVMVALSIIGFRYLLRTLVKDTLAGVVDDNNNETASSDQPILHALRSSWDEMWNITALRSLLCLVAFNGFFHIGVFIVALPLLVQQVYGESVMYFSGLQFTFLLGTIVATVVVIVKGSLDSPGKRLIFGLLYGGVILFALSAKPTVIGLFILLFFWGVVVGVSANMGRSILQSLAPEHCRGRIISLYQLALFGFAPLGALFAGYAIHWWGVMELLKISGIASLVMFMGLTATRALWEVRVDSENGY
ncbi:MAG: MFS family permease [Candidatus Endobugula sp.]